VVAILSNTSIRSNKERDNINAHSLCHVTQSKNWLSAKEPIPGWRGGATMALVFYGKELKSGAAAEEVKVPGGYVLTLANVSAPAGATTLGLMPLNGCLHSHAITSPAGSR